MEISQWDWPWGETHILPTINEACSLQSNWTWHEPKLLNTNTKSSTIHPVPGKTVISVEGSADCITILLEYVHLSLVSCLILGQVFKQVDSSKACILRSSQDGGFSHLSSVGWNGGPEDTGLFCPYWRLQDAAGTAGQAVPLVMAASKADIQI
jgi:hypothetical protein